MSDKKLQLMSESQAKVLNAWLLQACGSLTLLKLATNSN